MPRKTSPPAADFEAQRVLCAALPGATEDIKWGADLVFSVGARMFCVFLLTQGNVALPLSLTPAGGGRRKAAAWGRLEGRATTCSFKVDDERFLELTGVPGVIPAPYLARAKWVQLKPGHGLSADDLDSLVRRSHALVAAKLTRKLQTELGILR